MKDKSIIVKGAKVHNLKNINIVIPRDKLVVITGLSGSGKSSLAFDTIYAEGQRRYVESLSAYARQFLEQMQKPDVEYIEGLSPAISIEQRVAGSNPRSTVATQTEIYDYLRLLFARVGTCFCCKCGRLIKQQSPGEIVNQILKLPQDTKMHILAPLVKGRKGEYKKLFTQVKKEGFVRVRVDNRIFDVDEKIVIDKNKRHNIDVVIDRLSVSNKYKDRLIDSVETALKIGGGIVKINPTPLEKVFLTEPVRKNISTGVNCINNKRVMVRNSDTNKDLLFSQLYACPECEVSIEEIEPRIFSFNSPYGACSACNGLGTKLEIDPDLVVDKNSTLRQGTIGPWKKGGRGYILYYRSLLRDLAEFYEIDMDITFKNLSQKEKEIILYGSDESICSRRYEGVIPHLERLFRETDSDYLKEEITRFMSTLPCPQCRGARLKPQSLAVKIENKSIHDIVSLSITQAKEFFSTLELSGEKAQIAQQILKEITRRINFMINVGLEYLTLDRMSSTLSGGEAERVRLATQIGSGLVGVLYILDEPSIGLHQKDLKKLLVTLKMLRDKGNTLLVVEHDEFTIREADHIIDLGPGAGKYGGEVIAEGSLTEILNSEKSLTSKYLKGELKIQIPKQRREYKNRDCIIIKGTTEHNLKNINVHIPLGILTCVTGVSGSGKSTLINEVLYRALAQKLYRTRLKPGQHKAIIGAEKIDKIIVIDQTPIGRTPRSNPATYTGVFSYIRQLFSQLPEAKMRGYKPGRFSFNVKGGRCQDCQGDGIKKVEMHFLPDVYVECEECKGKRYNSQTLEIRYKGFSISEVLHMSVEDVRKLFSNIPVIKNKLNTLIDVGLGYIELGQSATTLSGGEAQRIKLAAELSKKASGKTFYILDEPTTGLHFADIDKLLKVLQSLVDSGNTVVVIEHNLDVIKQADFVIDLGPEGGEKGGHIVASGTPDEVAENINSYTGRFLKRILTVHDSENRGMNV